FLTGRRFADDDDIGLGAQQRLQPAPDYRMVVHKEHGNGGHRDSFDGPKGRAGSGIWAAMIVPSPGVLSTDNSPPSCSMRCRMARSPYPPVSDGGGTAPGSKPRPSSNTSRVTASGRYPRVTLALSAWA